MDTPDPKPITDPHEIRKALAAHGVPIAELSVQHASSDGTTYRFDVKSENAVSTWERIRPLAGEIGYYPVVCCDEHGTLAELPELNETPPAEALRRADEISATEWFDQRVAGDPEYYGNPEQGEWKDSPPQSGWTVPFGTLTGKPKDGVWIALVPTATPWRVPAYLSYGNWNECPPTDVHVAVQRYWYERYGAELVCVSGDVVEMRVMRPPTDREAAMALAREQFIYSGGDLVYQGHESLSKLAAALVGADYWFFWWD